jgi:hypothetical protein
MRQMAGFCSRWSGALVGLALASTLAACGATMNGAVIGVPAHIAPSAIRSASDPPAVAHLQTSVNELNEAAAVHAGPESPQLIADISALSNNHTLVGAEKGDVLKQFAAYQIAVRQALVSSLIANVQARPRLGGVQRAAIISHLKVVRAHLTNLGSAIAADRLVDRLRTEITAITPEALIYNIVQPVNHTAKP